jgi:predicted AAA+ superfamily ATPase
MYSTEEKALLLKKFKEYFEQGGMPEAVVLQNEQILTSVINDIIHKDIVTRYSVRKPAELKAVLKFLLANIAHPITYRSIQNNFRIHSANTIQKYIEYAEDTYLVFTVHRYEKKLKQFDKNPKKIYCVDNGIILKHTPQILEQQGALLENLVAVQLKRLGKSIYYYRGKTNAECDFVLPNEHQALQVCAQLHDQNREREIKGLQEALEMLHGRQGQILTFDQEGQLTRNNITVIIQPVWQWLLENEPSA